MPTAKLINLPILAVIWPSYCTNTEVNAACMSLFGEMVTRYKFGQREKRAGSRKACGGLQRADKNDESCDQAAGNLLRDAVDEPLTHFAQKGSFSYA
jgi:hypothetical protein